MSAFFQVKATGAELNEQYVYFKKSLEFHRPAY